MRCLSCGSDMILMNVVADDTMAVAGFEHHTFMCSTCKDVERRLVFAKPEEEGAAAGAPATVEPAAGEPVAGEPVAVEPAASEPVAVEAAPPLSPVAGEQHERSVPPGILMRVFAKLRGG